MRKFAHYILLLIFIMSSRAGISQPWYFNQVYNPNNTWAAGKSIIGIESGYFGCAITGDSVSDYYYQTAAFNLLPDGDIFTWRNYGRDSCDFYPGDGGSLSQNNDYFGLFGTVIDFVNDMYYGLFYKFNVFGDTIFTRTFTSDCDSIFVGRICSATNDGGYALLANVSGNDYNKELLLIKIDSNGNELWRNWFGSDSAEWAKSLIQTTDNGYAIGSWRYYIGVNAGTYDPVVYKADSLGNYEWEINLGGPYADDEPMLCNSQDSCIIALTTYGDTMLGFTVAKARTDLIKINLSGEVLWNYKFSTNDVDNHSSGIIALENGDYMTCGYSWSSAFLETSWLFRFSSNGDSLWFRDYYYYYGDNYLYAVNKLYDVSSTEDHGFVATGQAYTSDPPNDIQKMWVLKVDSVGCEIENCWVGIEEDMETGRQGDKGNLLIWPNPARDIVNCQLSIVEGRRKSSPFNLQPSISIYDIFGRIAPTPALPQPGEGEWMLDVSSLLPGIYFIVVQDERNVIGTGKFVVAR